MMPEAAVEGDEWPPPRHAKMQSHALDTGQGLGCVFDKTLHLWIKEQHNRLLSLIVGQSDGGAVTGFRHSASSEKLTHVLGQPEDRT